MKINLYNIKRIASAALVLTHIGLFTGCQTSVNKVTASARPKTSITSTVTDSNEVSNTKSLLEKYNENPINSSNLNNDIKTYYGEHIEEISDVLNPEYHDIQVTYGAMVYQRLINAGIPKEVILTELTNVMLEQQSPNGIGGSDWKESFGNIVSVLNEEESMYDAYFCLAYLIHDDLCELNHEINDVGAITCDNLKIQKNLTIKSNI